MVELVGVGVRACVAYDRSDLASQLETVRDRLTDPSRVVLVAGEYKQGKSRLVNALVDADVCPVDPDAATTIPTIVRWAAERSARVVGDEEATAEPGQARHVEVALDRPILAEGVVLVDTPGAVGFTSTVESMAAAVPYSDGVIFVSDASQELTASELAFLELCVGMCPFVVLALTKTDLAARWRDIADANRSHLERAGLDVRVIGVSGDLSAVGLERGDVELLAESGVPALAAVLRSELLGRSGRLAATEAAQAVLQAVAQIEETFRVELASLTEEDAARVDAEARCREGAERYRATAARWPVALGDRFADLVSAVDFELRRRSRALADEAEAAIDAIDPARAWDTFEPWLYNQTTQELSRSYADLAARIEAVEAEVAALFAGFDPGEVVTIRVGTIEEAVEDAPRATLKLGSQPRLVGRAMIGLRGGYSATLMFSSLGALASVTVAAPALLGLGLITGARAVKEGRQRAVEQNRQQAKQAVRRYLDEVTTSVGKHQRDSVRHAQRDLRNVYQQRAESLLRSLQDAEAALAVRATSTALEREVRRRDIEAELARLDGLRARVDAARPDPA